MADRRGRLPRDAVSGMNLHSNQVVLGAEADELRVGAARIEIRDGVIVRVEEGGPGPFDEVLGDLADTSYVSSTAEIDFDNDGDFDLFVTRADHPFELKTFCRLLRASHISIKNSNDLDSRST